MILTFDDVSFYCKCYKTRWFVKLIWAGQSVKQCVFFHLQIVIGAKSNMFTCKLPAWVIFIILFTTLLSYTSNSLTYKPWSGRSPTSPRPDCVHHLFLESSLPDYSLITRISFTYKPRKAAEFNTLMCQLCQWTSHADKLFTVIYPISHKKTIYII